MKRIVFFLAMVLGALPTLAQTSKNGRIVEGTLASRPTVCTSGDYYVAIDQNPVIEFKCSTGNTWNPEASGGGGGGTPGGVTQNIQYNAAGAFGGDTNFTWDFTNKVLNVAGNITQKGPVPSVNVMAFGALGTGNIHDDTGAIQAAINYACTKNSAVIEFPTPPAYYSVTQTQTGTSATQPIFYGCGGPANPALNFLVLEGSNGVVNRPQFSTSGVAITALTGASPNPAPMFLLGTGNTIRNLNILGRNEAIQVIGPNNMLEDTSPFIQGGGTPTATLPTSPLVIYDVLWFWMRGGTLTSTGPGVPTLTLLQDGGQPLGQIFISDVVENGAGIHCSQILASQVAGSGTWEFRNVLNENLSTAFMFFDDDGTHHWGLIPDISFLNSGTSDGTPPAFVTLNSTGMQIRGLSFINSFSPSNVATPLVQVFAGSVVDVFNTGSMAQTRIVDGSGNLLGDGRSGNGSGFDYFTSSTLGHDETFIDVQNGVQNIGPPVRVFAAGNSQASVGVNASGLMLNNGTNNGWTGQLTQTTPETIDVGFARYLPPTNVTAVATTGGVMAPGTYHYAIAAVDAQPGNNHSALSNQVAVVVSGPNNAVNISWTPSATSVVTPGGYNVIQTDGNRFDFVVGASSSSATDPGNSTGGWGCCYPQPNANILAVVHRFTATSLGVNTLSPGYNLDVNGQGHYASYVDFTEIAAPANPTSGTERVWADSSTHLFTCKISSGASCISGGGGGGSFQVNGVGVISSTTINFQNSAAFNGLTATFTNPSAGNVQLGFSGALGIGGGGTGGTTATAAFNALAPPTSSGGLIVGNGTNSYTNLGVGSNGQVLTVSAGTPTWLSPATVSTTGSPLATQGAFFTSANTVTGSGNWTYSAASGHSITQGANNTDILYAKRATDVSPTGNLLHLQNNAANADIVTIDVNGNMSISQQLTTGTGATTHFSKIPEGTTAGGGTGFDVLSADATSHSLQVSNNNLSFASVALFASSTLTPHSVMLTNTTFPLLTQSGPGVAGQCFVSNGAALDPSFQACVGSVNFNNLLAATAANTPINNGDFAQKWNWSKTTNSTVGLELSENIASTATTASLFRVDTLSTSTLFPVTFTAQGTANGVQMSTAGVLGAIGTGGINATLCTSGTCATTATGTANTIAKYTGAAALANSLISDNGTTLTYTGVGGMSFTSANASISDTEGVAPAGAVGVDILWGDSTAHAWKFIVNNGSAQTVPAAQTCTNKVLVLTDAAATASNCKTITSAYVDTSIALTGTDINTSNQVIGTHLASPTSNTLVKVNGTGGLVNSAITDNGIQVATSEAFDFTTKQGVEDVGNAAVTGTTVNLLAKKTSSGAIIIATTDTSIPVYIVQSGAGISGVTPLAQLVIAGQGDCVMDATTSNTEGFFVVASTTTAGDCHAQSAQPAAGVFVVGVLTSNSTTTGATAKVTVLNSFSAIGSTTTCSPNAFPNTQTDGATVTWAIASAVCANATLTFTVHSGSRTLNLTGLVNGGSYVIKLIQDATGGENLTGGTGCTWKQRGGGGSTFTLTGTANAQDILAFTYDGTNCYANLGLAYN